MSEPLNVDLEPQDDVDDASAELPVELDVEGPEADLLEQSLAVELHPEGYGYE